MSKGGRKWHQILRKQAASGLSGAEYCRRQGVNLQHFYYYHQKEERQRRSAGGFLPARIVSGQAAGIEIELQGVRIRLAEAAESEVVVRTIRAVREALC